jgi:hypothetical protein
MLSSNGKPLGADEFTEVLFLMALYCQVFDGRRWDDLDQVFTPDFVIDYSSSGRGTFQGIPALRQHMIDNPPLVLSHMFTNACAFTEKGGEVRARSTLLGPVPDGPPLTGTYDDVLVRTDRGWRISRRDVRLRKSLGDA